MHGCLISRHSSSLIWLKSTQWHPVFSACQGNTFSFPSSRHWTVFLPQWGWAYEEWGDQCPEGSLPEGRWIAEPDAETDSVVSCHLPTQQVTPASGFRGNPLASVMMVRQPRGLPRPGHKVSSLSLAWKNGPVFPGFITVCLGTFFFFLFLMLTHSITEGNSRMCVFLKMQELLWFSVLPDVQDVSELAVPGVKVRENASTPSQLVTLWITRGTR